MNYDLTGKVDVSLNGIKIPAQFLNGDDGVVTTITEGTREIPTMEGVVKQPSGTIEDAMVSFSAILPNMNYLKNIFPDLYTASSDRPLVAGRISFGGTDCVSRTTTPVVIHYTCQENSDNDVFIPAGSVIASIELTQNVSDAVSVAVEIQAQPSAEFGGVRAWLGTGDLTEPSIWDATTETYVAVGSF